jgi:hypothetical protein
MLNKYSTDILHNNDLYYHINDYDSKSNENRVER